jgi:hypothetical protein
MYQRVFSALLCNLLDNTFTFDLFYIGFHLKSKGADFDPCYVNFCKNMLCVRVSWFLTFFHFQHFQWRSVHFHLNVWKIFLKIIRSTGLIHGGHDLNKGEICFSPYGVFVSQKYLFILVINCTYNKLLKDNWCWTEKRQRSQIYMFIFKKLFRYILSLR